MRRKVVFSPSAGADLRELYLYIAERSGDVRAMAYIDRIETYCRGFDTLPERGTRRDDLLQGLRIVLAFHVDATTVTFDRILYGGRDLGGAFEHD